MIMGARSSLPATPSSQIEHYIALLDAHGFADVWTSAADVEATKPQPDLVNAALEHAEAPPELAVMIGHSPWNAQAAQRARVQTLAVMTGGFSKEELCQAAAIAVYESLTELKDALGQTILSGKPSRS